MISQVSDQNVVIYTDCVKKMLRRRMSLARIARLTSSSFAVLTAATAAALGATAMAPLTAITALAAFPSAQESSVPTSVLTPTRTASASSRRPKQSPVMGALGI